MHFPHGNCPKIANASCCCFRNRASVLLVVLRKFQLALRFRVRQIKCLGVNVCVYFSVFVSSFVYGSCVLVCVSISVLILSAIALKRQLNLFWLLRSLSLLRLLLLSFVFFSHCAPTHTVESGSSSRAQ